MFSPTYPKWGCRCCADAHKGPVNTNWNVYRTKKKAECTSYTSREQCPEQRCEWIDNKCREALICSAGRRGQGGKCNCTGAPGWNSSWSAPWCAQGACQSGMQNDTHCIGNPRGTLK